MAKSSLGLSLDGAEAEMKKISAQKTVVYEATDGPTKTEKLKAADKTAPIQLIYERIKSRTTMSRKKRNGYKSACVAVMPWYRPMTYQMVWPDDKDGGGLFLAKATLYNMVLRRGGGGLSIEQATL